MARIRDIVRELSGTVLDAIRTRVELFGLEWQQARGQVAVLIGLLLAGVAFLWLAAMLFSVMVIVLAWNTPYRDVTVIGLLALYLILGFGSLLLLRRRLNRREALPFAGTTQELAKDAQAFSRSLDAYRDRKGRDEDETSDNGREAS